MVNSRTRSSVNYDYSKLVLCIHYWRRPRHPRTHTVPSVDMGHEVGKAIASHPVRHNHTIQATLSQPNVAPGQSNDPRQLGSSTCTVPVSTSLPTFNYGPYVQAFQPQPNDKHTRRIDEATHQVVQQYLPTPVKIRYDAAHNSGVTLPVGNFIDGFQFVVETSVGHGHQVFCRGSRCDLP